MRSHRLRALIHAGCLLLLCFAASCRSAEKPRNLLLVSIDTLRSDHLGAYGYARPTSPFLDRFAREGVVFEHAYSTGSWTVPSHASMLTGRYPRSHGMRTPRDVMNRNLTTLAETLKSHGFATAGIVNDDLLRTGTGFERGFAQWTMVPAALGAEPAAPRVSALALDWFDHHRERPFFVFLHYYDVHSPYRPLDSYQKLLV